MDEKEAEMMRNPRLRDIDGTVYDPETGYIETVAVQIAAAEARIFQRIEFSDWPRGGEVNEGSDDA